MGSLFLSQQQYIKALDTFSRGGYWEDAAYIAEHIMKIDEHQNYIDQTWPGNTPEDSTIQMSIDTRLRFLLARRLARLDRWQDARKYYPVKWQNRMDVYVQAIQDGNNQKFLKSKRADALWKAAVIARYEGMELMGTELEPDWFLYDGNEFRRTFMQDIREGKISDTIAPSSTDEIQRTQQIILPDKRFHYRYIATEHAWQAAELMPDNSDQTARVLCIAGSWIKLKDPMAADKFYKALVIRNRKTKLGQEADELRWFPKIEIDGAALLQEVNSQ